MITTMDDAEIDQLENIRRYGYPDNQLYDEEDYFQLPPKRYHLIRNWADWRRKTNDRLIANIFNSDGYGFETGRELTGTAEEKTPDCFKGRLSFEGRRVKDEYGGRAIMDCDNEVTRFEKKLIDENFFIFGIPRVSLRRMEYVNGENAHRETIYDTCYDVLCPTAPEDSFEINHKIMTTSKSNSNSVPTEFSMTSTNNNGVVHKMVPENKQREHKVSWKYPLAFSRSWIS